MSEQPVVVGTNSPVAKNKARLTQVAQRLGCKVISTRSHDDLPILGQLLEESGAVHAGRGLYLLAADHMVRLLSSVSDMRAKLDEIAPDSVTEEKMHWAELHRRLIDSTQELGQQIIKSETILRELPKPVQTNVSFLPGSVVGPVKIALHKEPQPSEAIDVGGNGTNGQ